MLELPIYYRTLQRIDLRWSLKYYIFASRRQEEQPLHSLIRRAGRAGLQMRMHSNIFRCKRSNCVFIVIIIAIVRFGFDWPPLNEFNRPATTHTHARSPMPYEVLDLLHACTMPNTHTHTHVLSILNRVQLRYQNKHSPMQSCCISCSILHDVIDPNMP